MGSGSTEQNAGLPQRGHGASQCRPRMVGAIEFVGILNASNDIRPNDENASRAKPIAGMSVANQATIARHMLVLAFAQ